MYDVYDVTPKFHKKMQWMYDTIMLHLRTQKSRAVSKEDFCAYLTEDGKQCAIGCLIPKHLYHTSMEGLSAESLIKEYTELFDHLFGKDTTEMEIRAGQQLLDNMQDVHDSSQYPTRGWIGAAHKIGKNFKLSTQGR